MLITIKKEHFDFNKSAIDNYLSNGGESCPLANAIKEQVEIKDIGSLEVGGLTVKMDGKTYTFNSDYPGGWEIYKVQEMMEARRFKPFELELKEC